MEHGFRDFFWTGAGTESSRAWGQQPKWGRAALPLGVDLGPQVLGGCTSQSGEWPCLRAGSSFDQAVEGEDPRGTCVQVTQINSGHQWGDTL